MKEAIALFLLFMGWICFAVFLSAILSLPVMWLWNALLVGPWSVIGVSLMQLTWLKAWGLTILCTLLFKSSPTTTVKRK